MVTKDGMRGSSPWQRLSRRFARANAASLAPRIAVLEAEIQETRQLNRRLAELMDTIEHLLVPLATGDAAAGEYLSDHRVTDSGRGTTGGSSDSLPVSKP